MASLSVGAAAYVGSVVTPSITRAVVTSMASSWAGLEAFDHVGLMCTAFS